MKTTVIKSLFLAIIPLVLFGCGKDSTDDSKKVTSKSFSENGYIPNTLHVTRFEGTYAITGIIKRGKHLTAIINKKIVSSGTELDPGVVLTKITPTYVVISFGNSEYLIRPTEIQKKINMH
jgi:hypothetical protein